MILLLVIGLALVAAAALLATSRLTTAESERSAALASLEPRHVAPREHTTLKTLQSWLVRVYLRVTRTTTLAGVQSRLHRAGYAHRLTPEAFVAGQVALAVGGAVLGLALGQGAGALLLAVLLGALGGYLPHFALSRAATNRTHRIERELPHFVDQLAIAVEAGMSFDAALGYLLRATNGPLADELGRMANEVRVGETRRRALKNLSERVGSADLTLFANALVSSDQLGTPLSEILRAQASDVRHRRQMRIEEQAQKTPVKMLFPIVIFILPVMFVVILAPALIDIGRFL